MAAALVATVAAQDELTQGIDWRDDLAAARAEAKRTGKPLLAVFR